MPDETTMTRTSGTTPVVTTMTMRTGVQTLPLTGHGPHIAVEVVSIDEIRLVPLTILGAEILHRYSMVRTSITQRGIPGADRHPFETMQYLSIVPNHDSARLTGPRKRDSHGTRHLSAVQYDAVLAALDALEQPAPAAPRPKPRGKR